MQCNDLVEVPFTVVYDHREKRPYRFSDIKGDSQEKNRLLYVHKKSGYLKTGDYSIEGYEDRIAVERKSLIDLYGSLGRNRDRFKAEQKRLAEMEFAAVVVEASMSDILSRPPKHSNMRPKAVFRSMLFWSTCFKVQWFPCKNRRMAEVVTFRLLNYWFRQLRRTDDEEERTRTKDQRCRKRQVGRPAGKSRIQGRRS